MPWYVVGQTPQYGLQDTRYDCPGPYHKADQGRTCHQRIGHKYSDEGEYRPHTESKGKIEHEQMYIEAKGMLDWMVEEDKRLANG